ncbi:hypothetical protein CLORY_12720 [Clostridium oryzae]|uniref:Uncharacterized protein n=1 Tax=Clostridium oryzae TaxID=1450648 RepID=A0A1V4ITG4_9CLOT|nr:hypothetical protein CLORY_12720 [Clostridium oryzae]
MKSTVIDTINFVIIYIKCYLIMILFGIILPKIADYIIYFYYEKNIYYYNSTFVSILENKNFFWSIYFTNFKLFIKY